MSTLPETTVVDAVSGGSGSTVMKEEGIGLGVGRPDAAGEERHADNPQHKARPPRPPGVAAGGGRERSETAGF